MKNIAIDLDSTLIFPINLIKKKFKKYHKNIKWEEPLNFNFNNISKVQKDFLYSSFEDETIMCPDIKLLPFFAKIKLLKTIYKINNLKKYFNIIIITARCETIKKETINYVNKIFNVECIVSSDKLKIAKNKSIELIIDDKGETCKQFTENNLKSILISNNKTKYNHLFRKNVNFYISQFNNLNFKKINKILKKTINYN